MELPHIYRAGCQSEQVSWHQRDSLWLPYEEYDREDAEKAQKKGDEVLTVAKEFVGSWFAA